VAELGRPNAPRISAIFFCTSRALSGPPRAPRNSGFAWFRCVGAQLRILRYGLHDALNHRYDPRLAALAGDSDACRSAFDFRFGEMFRRQRQRFGDAQTAAIEQGEHRDVPRRDPWLLMLDAGLALHDGAGILHGNRPGQALLPFGRANGMKCGDLDALRALEISREGLQRGQASRHRLRRDAQPAARCQKGANVCWAGGLPYRSGRAVAPDARSENVKNCRRSRP
jgi:hypothetical protein